MSDKSLDDVLTNFNAVETNSHDTSKPITLWLPEEYKARYDELQKKSSRRFCKTLRELVLMAIDKTDQKLS